MLKMFVSRSSYWTPKPPLSRSVSGKIPRREIESSDAEHWRPMLVVNDSSDEKIFMRRVFATIESVISLLSHFLLGSLVPAVRTP